MTTKEEWKLCYRYLRAHQKNKRQWLTAGYLNRILKEQYDHLYTPTQRAFRNLVYRYRGKGITRAHLRKLRLDRKLAREASKDYLSNLVYRENPFLSLVPKEDQYAGAYIAVQLGYE